MLLAVDAEEGSSLPGDDKGMIEEAGLDDIGMVAMGGFWSGS